MFTPVHPCFTPFPYVYSCLSMFYSVKLVYPSLFTFDPVYLSLPKFTGSHLILSFSRWDVYHDNTLVIWESQFLYNLLLLTQKRHIFFLMGDIHREYFMESAGVRYLRTSCWRIRNRTSERNERVRFLIQNQRVRKYRIKHFPCGIVFIIYMLRHSSFWRPFYFKSFENAKICRYTLTEKWKRKQIISFLVETFVKNINDGEDMR